MKKAKRILALSGVILLVAMYVATLVFALLDSPNSFVLFNGTNNCIPSTLLQLIANIINELITINFSIPTKLLPKNQGDNSGATPINPNIKGIDNALTKKNEFFI